MCAVFSMSYSPQTGAEKEIKPIIGLIGPLAMELTQSYQPDGFWTQLELSQRHTQKTKAFVFRRVGTAE